MPRATFPASICPAGRQGQRRFLCRLPGRRSSALPFRPIGGAPGAASLSSIPSRPDSGCRARSPPSPKPASEPFPFPILSDNARAHSRSREPAGCPFPFPLFPDSRHVLPGGGHARLIPPAPARGCSRRISPSISAPLCLPRSPLLCARPFRAGFFGSALPCSPPPRAVSGPVPARADASRRSFAFSHARRAPFLPCAPCAPGLCASRRGDGRSASPARPACVETTRSKSPARQRIPARPACMPAPRTPGASVPPRTPGASVPPRAAVRFGSHSAVQSLPIFFHRPAGKRTQKANLIRTYVRIRF